MDMKKERKQTEKMKIRELILGAALCGALPLCAAPSYTGRVYADTNGNGRYDRGEKAMRGIMVSDGLNVTRTSSDGRYTLPGHPRERFLFVTVPGGYKALRHYHRIEQGVRSYDFALQPYGARIAKDGSHRFVHISDTEISTAAGQEEWVDDLRTYASNEGAAFLIHTGDICYEKGLKAHLPMMNTANMDLPVYYCIGNHDLVQGARGEELFERIYGPVYYSFNAGKVHYIVTPMWSGDYRPGYTREDVLCWMRNDLAQLPEGMPVVVFNHDYWTTGERHLFTAGGSDTIDLDARNLKAWIYGHVHTNHITRHGGVLAVCTSTPARGGIDHSPSAFRTLHVDGAGNLRSELRYTYIDKSLEIASVQNDRAPVGGDGRLTVSVNAYSTVSPTAQVDYACYVDGRDVTGRRAMTQVTDFNWRDRVLLPARYRGRTVTLRATARFRNGETAVRESRFTYEPGAPAAHAPTDWTNLGGNAQHTGVSRDTVSLPVSLAWTTNIGSNIYMASPLVYRNCVYAATADENAGGRSAVVSLDAAHGSVRWRHATRGPVRNTIVAARGLVFAQDAYGYLYALDAVNGRLVWERKLKVTVIPGLNDGLVASDDRVFAGSGLGLCALDALTGRLLWQNTAWAQREGTTSTLSLSPDGGVLVGGVQWGAMYANAAADGRLLWSRSDRGIRNRASSPAMHGGSLYFLSQRSLFVLSAHDGGILVEKELPYSVDVTSTPLVTPEEVIFGTAEEGLVALDRHTLAEKWRFRTGRALIYTAPYVNGEAAQVECSAVLSGDVVWFGASDGVFYALDRRNGALLWRHKTGAPVMTTVAVSGQMVFGADFAGNIYAFRGQ